MNYYLFILLVILLLKVECFGQINPGARQIALSHADVANNNTPFSVFNNPAGLELIKKRVAGIFYSPSPFGLSELKNIYGSIQQQTEFGSFGVGIKDYGFELFKENEFTLAYANNWQNKIYFGAAFSYRIVAINNYGTYNSIIVNLGSIYKINNYANLGFIIRNITRSSLGNTKNQIPIEFEFGGSYSPVHYLSIFAAVEKNLDFDPAIRFGIEYSPLNFLTLRSGFTNSPSSISAGIGIKYSFVKFNYGLFTHQELGLTHQIGLIFILE